MSATYTVGEFSRPTHLPVRTLHHYHEVGVLTPAEVASLQALLTSDPAPPPVRMCTEPDRHAVSLTESVAADEIGDFCGRAYPRLAAALGPLEARPTGPGAALYDAGWFADGGGHVTAFLPVDVAPPGPPPATRPGRVQLTTVPGATYAVALHAGPFDEIDLTYGRLGRHVLDHATGADGPIREIYLVTPADTTDPAALRTEVGWPVHS